MARLIFSAITSLDGYVADPDGDFEWAAPDEQVHEFVNDLERPIGTYLYGRLLYEVMSVWQSDASTDGQPPVAADFASIWRAADKIVFSSTLDEPATPRTRIERTFDPEAIRRLRDTSDRDLSIGGPHLAAQAIRAGLVDDYHLFVNPIMVGGGNAALPDDVRVPLELVDEHRFVNGVVHLHYRRA